METSALSRPSFKNLDKTNFLRSLENSIKEFFTSRGIEKTGNWALYTKAAILLSLFAGLFVWLVYFTPGSFLVVALVVAPLFGLTQAAIGFNIMHDACHESFSGRKWVNNLFGLSLNVMGGYDNWWREKHNVFHHTFTNIHEVDEDVNIPLMRVLWQQPRKWFHKYQHYYWPFMYMLTYLAWIWFGDYRKYFSNKIGKYPFKKFSGREHVRFWASKSAYIFVFIVLPIIFCGWKIWLLWYLVSGVICGFSIAIVFQLAHLVENVSQPTLVDGNIENEWAIHQVQTTANFATKSKVLGWLVGGLNFQVEHHLLRHVSHIHYPAIQPIVKEKCRLFGIVYNEQPTLVQSIASHVKQLKQFGSHD